MDATTKDKALIGLAECVVREEHKRARDVAAALDDFRNAEPDDKVMEAVNVLTAAKVYEDRYRSQLARTTLKVLEQATGKSVEQLFEGMDSGGIAFDLASGGLHVVGDNGDTVEDLLELTPGEPDSDSTPSGLPDIEGIDLSTLADEPEELI